MLFRSQILLACSSDTNINASVEEKYYINNIQSILNKLINLKKIKSSEPLLALQYKTIGGNQTYFNKYLKYKSKYLVKKYGQINNLNENINKNDIKSIFMVFMLFLQIYINKIRSKNYIKFF